MNRYIFYFVFVNMLTTMAIAVPRVLLMERMNGTVISIFLATIIGTIFTYIFLKFFSLFPGKSLPELLTDNFSGWFAKPIILFLTILWYGAGLITFTASIFIYKRYLSPDMPIRMIVIIFLLFFSYGILMKTKSVLYTVEMISIISLPLALLFVFKSYGSKYFKLDFVKEAIMYSNTMPSYVAFSASLFVFLGVANLIIFNQAFTEKRKVKMKHILFLATLGLITLINAFFIPIGINGFHEIDSLVYPAVTTSDTLRMPFGIVERVLFVFLTLFIAIFFLSNLIHWHVAIELFNSIITIKKLTWKGNNLTPYFFVLFIWISSLILIPYFNEEHLIIIARYFFNSLLVIFLFIILLFWLIKRREKI